jgi:hypothetical protein
LAKVRLEEEVIYFKYRNSKLTQSVYKNSIGKHSTLTCMVNVPELLSSSPWISKIGFLILLADMKGLISI